MINVLYGNAKGIVPGGDQASHQDVSGIRGATEQGDLFGG